MAVSHVVSLSPYDDYLTRLMRREAILAHCGHVSNCTTLTLPRAVVNQQSSWTRWRRQLLIFD